LTVQELEHVALGERALAEELQDVAIDGWPNGFHEVAREGIAVGAIRVQEAEQGVETGG